MEATLQRKPATIRISNNDNNSNKTLNNNKQKINVDDISRDSDLLEQLRNLPSIPTRPLPPLPVIHNTNNTITNAKDTNTNDNKTYQNELHTTNLTIHNDDNTSSSDKQQQQQYINRQDSSNDELLQQIYKDNNNIVLQSLNNDSIESKENVESNTGIQPTITNTSIQSDEKQVDDIVSKQDIQDNINDDEITEMIQSADISDAKPITASTTQSTVIQNQLRSDIQHDNKQDITINNTSTTQKSPSSVSSVQSPTYNQLQSLTSPQHTLHRLFTDTNNKRIQIDKQYLPTITQYPQVRLLQRGYERASHDSAADLYALIVTIEHCELAYVRDAVSYNEYTLQCSKLLNQYKVLSSALADSADTYNLSEFMRNHQLNCKHAAHRIKINRPATSQTDIQSNSNG